MSRRRRCPAQPRTGDLAHSGLRSGELRSQPGPHRNAWHSLVWETRGPKSHLPVTAQAGTSGEPRTSPSDLVPVTVVTPSGCLLFVGGVGYPSVTPEDPGLGLEPGLSAPRAPGNTVSVGGCPEGWTEPAAGPLRGASRAGASGTPPQCSWNLVTVNPEGKLAGEDTPR